MPLQKMNRTLSDHTIGQVTVELVCGDITQEQVDAIVNAANASLKHGGGLAAIIVRKGGEEIQKESDEWVARHGPVPHDRPAYTMAGQLPARYVIHAVGPVWRGGDQGEDEKLAQAIYGSLQRADALGLRSIALPAISTGIFGFPKERAAQITLETIERYLKERSASRFARIKLVLFDEETLKAFEEAWRARWGG